MRQNNFIFFRGLKAKIIMLGFLALWFFSAHAGILLAAGADESTALWGTQAASATAMGAPSLLARSLQIFSILMIVVVLGFAVYAAIMWSTSNGDEERVDKARNILMMAAVALVIALILYVLAVYWVGRSRQPMAVGESPATTGTTTASSEPEPVIGNCSLRSIFPELEQRGVPRNMPIVIGFKTLINPATICVLSNGAKNCNGAALLSQNIRIFAAKDRAACENGQTDCPSLVKDAKVYSRDNKTFTIVPDRFLGSETENVRMMVRLNGAIEKVNADATHQGAFASCRYDFFSWQFELSRSVDVTPPSIKKNGVFPPPDDYADRESVTRAESASKKLVLNDGRKIKVNRAARILKVKAGPKTPDIEVIIDQYESYSGVLRVVAKNSNQLQLELVGAPSESLRSALIKSGEAYFPGFLRIKTETDLTPGNFWELSVAGAVPADTITINERVFSFTDQASGPNQIQYSDQIDALLNNIVATIDATPDLASWSNGADIFVGLKNERSSVPLIIHTNSPAFKIVELRKGRIAERDLRVRDKRDKPRNTVIQVSFTEPMNASFLAGSAQDLVNFIRVKCLSGQACNAKETGFFKCGADVCVDGEFKLSNQGTVVEFISNTQCGVNSCGAPIYCLPAASRLQVELKPASLADCSADNCASRGNFNICGQDQHCRDQAGHAYPGVDIGRVNALDGLTDAAFNSLDGNRDGFASGPTAAYDENSGTGAGDIFSWSFFTSADSLVRLPEVNSIFPASSSTVAVADKSLIVNFDSLMLSSSLQSGQIQSPLNDKQFFDLVNLEGVNSPQVGYWIMNYNINYSGLVHDSDGYTKMEIRHLPFPDKAKYFAAIGSGVRDIYQNCFKPSSSKFCQGAPSCCNEAASGELSCESLKK